MTSPHSTTWRESLAALREREVMTMLLLGFSAGLPLLLIFSSLSLWLREAGIERRAVTFFSWAALGYSFKFIWAPLIDILPIPFLTRQLGRRRAWLLVAQLAVGVSIVAMALIDPAAGKTRLVWMALAAVSLGFSSATQDIVIDAYRIEAAPLRLQALMSATYIAGYRVAMVVSGAGALYLAAGFGSAKGAYLYTAWRGTYFIMAAMMLIGLFTTLTMAEPAKSGDPEKNTHSTQDYLRLVLVFGISAAAFALVFFYSSPFFHALKTLSGNEVVIGFLLEASRFALSAIFALGSGYVLAAAGLVSKPMVYRTWIAPVMDFFSRYGLQTACLLLAIIGLYRISDIVLGVIANVFYQDMGFSKPEIATAVKTFGVLVSIAGGMLGGLLSTRFGVMPILMTGAVLASATNLIFIILAQVGHSPFWLYTAVCADNLAAGVASAAFVAFLSGLTSISFTAVQYAIFSSLMTLLPKVLGGYSGAVVDKIGYSGFFVFTTLIGLPVLVLLWLAARRLELKA